MHKHLHGHESPAQTEGRLIPWALHYDLVVNMMTFGRARRLRSLTAENALLQAGEHVLDAGCGTGSVSVQAKLRVGENGRVVGIDPSPDMIAVARQKADRAGLKIDFRVGVIESLPYSDESFDVVISSLMMHHLPEHIQAKGLAEIKRVLKPGGRLLIAEIARPGKSFFRKFLNPVALHQAIRHDGVEPFGIEDLPGLLERSGFMEINQLASRFLGIGFLRAKKPISQSLVQ